MWISGCMNALGWQEAYLALYASLAVPGSSTSKAMP